MTNAAIIQAESFKLMDAGILQGSGHYGIMIGEDGSEQKVELPEAIHTFAAWKQLGFKVKKGEHAIASFAIWKYAERQLSEEEQGEDGAETESRMFMKKACFFKRSQVERITH